MLKTAELWLRKGADRRLRAGHCWIYSNEIDSSKSPLANFQAGDLVTILSSSGDCLGCAYMEPQSLICARRYSDRPQAVLDGAFFRQAIDAALALRQRFFEQPYYRLIYGDSDGLSGVVVDRFGDYLVLQLNTAGIESHQEALLAALVDCLKPAGILLRMDSRARRDQGLHEQVEVAHGLVPETVALIENGVQFEAPLKSGQKTGWFYDHRSNRKRLQSLCSGRRVLDVYSYIGGWGVQAAAAGATEVNCVDSSEPALARVAHNAALNGVQDRVNTLPGRADQVMRDLVAGGEAYDVVVLDPPAFIPRRRDLGKGRKAYRRINELGLRLLKPGGLLVSASCSMHLSEADLLEMMAAAGQRSGHRLQVTELGGQGPDHPIHPAIAETRYLKAAFAMVNPAG